MGRRLPQLCPDAAARPHRRRGEKPRLGARFWGQAASGDWDAVIVGFSRFEKLQMSYGAQKAALTARIDEPRSDSWS
ncbi:MAG: hypothetical protein ACLT98_00410 [Eggerthellaceae bacterium]